MPDLDIADDALIHDPLYIHGIEEGAKLAINLVRQNVEHGMDPEPACKLALSFILEWTQHAFDEMTRAAPEAG